MTDQPTRRTALGAVLAPLVLAPAVAAAPRTPVITVLGDSLSSGYGLPAADALPAQLQRELARLGVNAVVRGEAVPGSTTAGGLRRVDNVRAGTDLCVVALGGNDLLSFIAPAQVRANLEGIVRRLKARKMGVVLAGLEAPAELGAYARSFNAVFPAVAQAQKVTLHRHLLAGVLLDSRYNLPDLVYPNALGVRIIAQRLAPTVAKALRAKAAART